MCNFVPTKFFGDMRNMKLVSLRIDQYLDEAFEKMANKDGWRKKSDYMRQALKVFMYLAEHEKLDYLYHFCPEWGDVVEDATFKFRRDPEGRQKWLALHPKD